MNRRATTPQLEAPVTVARAVDESAESDLASSDPFEDEVEPFTTVDEADEEAIERALTSVREGKGIPLDEFLAILQRA